MTAWTFAVLWTAIPLGLYAAAIIGWRITRDLRAGNALLRTLTEPPPAREPGHDHGGVRFLITILDDNQRPESWIRVFNDECHHMYTRGEGLIAANYDDAWRLAALETELEDT